MLKVLGKTDLNQISLTGARGIILLGLLMVAPRSLNEMREALIKLNIFDEESSNDTLRIDLNTLKYMGCEISRATKKNGYKYVLLDHPFSIKIEEDELNVLNEVYKTFKSTEGIYNLIRFDELCKKISKYIKDEKIKEHLLGISILKNLNNDMVKDLFLDCEQKRTIEIIYFNKAKSVEVRKELVAQKIIIQNDKLYLYAYDLKKKREAMLPINRIKEIILRKLQKDTIESKTTDVKFRLADIDVDDLNENEKIVEILDDGYIVEGSYHNDFIAIQRVLSFNSKCTVLEPEGFKKKVIAKLKLMRNIYGE